MNERHSGLCEELQQAEEHACSLERAIEECEVRCAKLHHNSTEDTDVDLDAKIGLCEAARAEVYQLPPWALRCAWRDALDLRASQLERVSGQLDGTKRSLDAANEELNWQATSAEALRTRLTDVLQATLAEERRGNQFLLEEARRRQTLQAGQKCIEEISKPFKTNLDIGAFVNHFTVLFLKVQNLTMPSYGVVRMCDQLRLFLLTLRHSLYSV